VDALQKNDEALEQLEAARKVIPLPLPSFPGIGRTRTSWRLRTACTRSSYEERPETSGRSESPSASPGALSFQLLRAVSSSTPSGLPP